MCLFITCTPLTPVSVGSLTGKTALFLIGGLDLGSPHPLSQVSTYGGTGALVTLQTNHLSGFFLLNPMEENFDSVTAFPRMTFGV